uniref:Uncharacterized protein n=1 Tax=Helianthus annuus TaxID=4232 RepID=A0A251SIE2_HELAN
MLQIRLNMFDIEDDVFQMTSDVKHGVVHMTVRCFRSEAFSSCFLDMLFFITDFFIFFV